METRRLLARALLAVGQSEQAVQRLDEAVATGPDDPEVVFLLASEYLWLKRVDAADRLFAQVVKARPIPQTHVLIGRAYRDAAEYAAGARAAAKGARRRIPACGARTTTWAWWPSRTRRRVRTGSRRPRPSSARS